MREAIGRFIDNHPWMTFIIALVAVSYGFQCVNNIGQALANRRQTAQTPPVTKLDQ